MKIKSKRLRPNDVLGRSPQEDRKLYREIALRAKNNVTQKRRFSLVFSPEKSRSGLGAKRPNKEENKQINKNIPTNNYTKMFLYLFSSRKKEARIYLAPYLFVYMLFCSISF